MVSAATMKLKIIVTGIIVCQFFCTPQQESYITSIAFTRLESDSTISYKLTKSDTLFRKIKTLQLIGYSYKMLAKKERSELLELISQLQKTGEADSSFEIGLGENAVILYNDNVRAYYTKNKRKQNMAFNKVVDKFNYFHSQGGFINVDLKTTFWNFDEMVEPPPPPNAMDSVKH